MQLSPCWNMIFGVTWICIPGPWPLLLDSGINSLLFPLAWELFFLCRQVQSVKTAPVPVAPASLIRLQESWGHAGHLDRPAALTQPRHSCRESVRMMGGIGCTQVSRICWGWKERGRHSLRTSWFYRKCHLCESDIAITPCPTQGLSGPASEASCSIVFADMLPECNPTVQFTICAAFARIMCYFKNNKTIYLHLLFLPLFAQQQVIKKMEKIIQTKIFMSK